MLTWLAYLAFVSLGLPDGLQGVAWPSIRATFALPIDALGTLLVTFTAGYLVSSFTSGWLLSRAGVGTLLALSCAATALSLLGYALAPAWSVMVALGVLSGLGAGAIDAGLNTFAATRFSARMVSWLHACYGVGAAVGPALMTVVLARGGPWQRGYAIVGLAQLALALGFALTRTRWTSGREEPAPSSPRPATIASTGRLPAVWLGVLGFLIYTGIEATAGTWAYSLFTEARGIPPGAAGTWVSLYWVSLTAGRLLAGALAGLVSPHTLLRACPLGLLLGATLVWLGTAGSWGGLGLLLVGLAEAPIFPSLISTTAARIGPSHVANAVGFQIAAAVLGQSVLPALAGVLARALGLEVIGAVLVAAALALSATCAALRARTRLSP